VVVIGVKKSLLLQTAAQRAKRWGD
jgi:hypothetical protein